MGVSEDGKVFGIFSDNVASPRLGGLKRENSGLDGGFSEELKADIARRWRSSG